MCASRYTGQDFIANVAFDIFTAATPDASPEYEFMIVSHLPSGYGYGSIYAYAYRRRRPLPPPKKKETNISCSKWLGAFGGAGPISSTGQPIGTATLAGGQWDLFYGLNGQMKVYSFVAASGSVDSFEGDLTEFSDYLIENHDVAASQLVLSVGGGSEPFEGVDVSFTTSRYVAQIV